MFFRLTFSTDTVSTLSISGTLIRNPYAIGFNAIGSLAYILTDAQLLSMPAAGGIVSSLAGAYLSYSWLDGTGTSARFNYPQAMAVHPVSGLVYIDAWALCYASGREI